MIWCRGLLCVIMYPPCDDHPILPTYHGVLRVEKSWITKHSRGYRPNLSIHPFRRSAKFGECDFFETGHSLCPIPKESGINSQVLNTWLLLVFPHILMSLIPLTFLMNVSIFKKLLSLGCLHRCQWKNPNFCRQPTQKTLLSYPHLGQAQTKVAKVAKVAVCTSAHQTVLRKLAPSNNSFRPSLDSTVGGWFKNPAPPDFEAAIVKPWRNAHG